MTISISISIAGVPILNMNIDTYNDINNSNNDINNNTSNDSNNMEIETKTTSIKDAKATSKIDESKETSENPQKRINGITYINSLFHLI